MIKKIKIFYLNVLFLQIFNVISSNTSSDKQNDYLIFNFLQETKPTGNNKELDNDNYMNKMLYSNIYTYFHIGIPRQKIKLHYNLTNSECIIGDNEYHKSRSTTYKLVDQKDYSLNNEKILLKSNETFDLYLKKLPNFQFFLFSYKNPKIDSLKYSYVGLNYYSKNNNITFFDQLKNNGIIQKKIFGFYFGEHAIKLNKEFAGQFFLGKLPHEINNEQFEKEDLSWTNALNEKWRIKFDKIIFDNSSIDENIVEFDVGLNAIIGPESFKKKLSEDFLKPFLDNKDCIEENFYSIIEEKTYIYYQCDKMTEFTKMPKLQFYSKSLNEIFEFSLGKLFFIKGSRVYFSIIFSKTPINIWKLGAMFFEKYRLVFDAENKKIGYYKTIPDETNFTVILISIIITLLVSLICWLQGYSKKYMMQNMGMGARQYNQSHSNFNNMPNNVNNNTSVKKEKIE